MKNGLIETVKRYSGIYHFIFRNDCIKVWTEYNVYYEKYNDWVSHSYDTGMRLNLNCLYLKNWDREVDRAIRYIKGI